ncbi:CRISPR system precrRNA processing endoribonuclease RAMP protein Cas6 [Vibrio vulnificus]|nr:CRISPR system precrRNA processing endoribonuclease RAMP protein Cas6 [Vibrio vulnificus]
MMVLNELASRFELVRFRVSLLLKEDTQLPEFKGSMWHGWFGQVLKAYDGTVYHICFGHFEERQPKPYVVCPVGDNKCHWRKGELIQVEISLFGQACELAHRVVDAIIASTTNPNIGIGGRKVPYQLVSVASVTPEGLKAGLYKTWLSDWAVGSFHHSSTPQELAMQFITPTRIKHHGQLVRYEVPNVGFWINHIIRRLVLLSQFWVLDNEHLVDAIYQEALSLTPPHLDNTESSVLWKDWKRYSKSSHEFQPFGGLVGHVSFFGELHSLVPYFKVGEQLQIGGKTTFGLGRYQLIC